MSPDRRPLIDFRALLATAIAGRNIAVVGSRSAHAYTDGAKIFLPDLSEHSNIVALVVQAALLRCGSLDRGVALRLVGKEAVTARYLRLEAARVATAAGDVLPRWIQESMAAAWQYVIPADACESLDRAIWDTSIPPAPNTFGSIRPLALLRKQAYTGTQGVPGKAEQRRAESQEQANDQNRDEVGGEGSGPPKTDDSTPVEGSASKFSRTLTRGGISSVKGEGNGAAATAVTWVRWISSKARAISSAFRFSLTDLPPDGGLLYPEWSYGSDAYLPDWCSVKLYELPTGNRLHRDLPNPLLRRRLARLGMELALHRRQIEGEHLDNDALTRHFIDVTSGFSSDGSIYESMRKTGRDLTTIVLVDASCSTNDRRSASTSIWEAQRELAAKVIAAFDELGDSVAAYGFRSFGRTDVRFLRIKEFGERFGQRARGRLMALNSFGFTRLGAAIRHSSHVLTARVRFGRRLLVIVSDGLPYDTGYENTHAEYDVRRALEEACQQGIGCVCLSAGSSVGKEAVERAWGAISHATLQTPSELNHRAESLFRSALARAASEGIYSRRRRATSTGLCADGLW